MLKRFGRRRVGDSGGEAQPPSNVETQQRQGESDEDAFASALSSSIRHHAAMLRDDNREEPIEDYALDDQTLYSHDPRAMSPPGSFRSLQSPPLSSFRTEGRSGSVRHVSAAAAEAAYATVSTQSRHGERQSQPPPPQFPARQPAFVVPPPSASIHASSGKRDRRQDALQRLALAVVCLCASLVLAVLFGEGRIGLEAATFMYKNAVIGEVSDGGGSESQIPPPLEEEIIIPDLEDMNIVLPEAMERLLADTNVTFDAGSRVEVPFFWQIPKSGGNAVKAVLGLCLKLAETSEAAAGYDEPVLRVVENDDGTRFVNVDTTSYGGIERAKLLNLAGSGVADVVITGLLQHGLGMFNEVNRARIFAVFRHPVERVTSKFYSEQLTNVDLADMTITQYARSGRLENNWVTRVLVDKVDGQLSDDDLNVARELLRRKFIVGVSNDFAGSLQLFQQYFGWNLIVENIPGARECQDALLVPSQVRHPSVEEGSEAWNLIMSQNRFDMKLFQYAQHLFQTQTGESVMFPR